MIDVSNYHRLSCKYFNSKIKTIKSKLDFKLEFIIRFIEASSPGADGANKDSVTPTTVNLKTNTPVEVMIEGKQYQGLVRWCGFIDEVSTTMAGLELVSYYARY